MTIAAIITAAGVGRRMGAARPKQFLSVSGLPILVRTLMRLAECEEIDTFIITTDEAWIDETKTVIKNSGFDKPFQVIAGGKERQDSVSNGLKALSDKTEIVLIHDAVRPFIKKDLIIASIDLAKTHGGAIVAVPVKDTIKSVDGSVIEKTVERRKLWAAQTPQTFRYAELMSAFQKAFSDNYYGTDDASIFERTGKSIRIIEGDYTNIKITTPEDLKVAEVFAGGGKIMKIGFGYDIHRLVEGRSLILGGVKIPFEKGLLGHSDADVLLHSISDALLGAAALGDIGKHFPDTDPKYKGADSRKLLKEVGSLIKEKGFSISNIDATVIAERPKLRTLIDEMRKNISEDLNVDIDNVSVKATTNEGLESIGKCEAIAVHAVALLTGSGE